MTNLAPQFRELHKVNIVSPILGILDDQSSTQIWGLHKVNMISPKIVDYIILCSTQIWEIAYNFSSSTIGNRFM